jgi:hypothetical protein
MFKHPDMLVSVDVGRADHEDVAILGGEHGRIKARLAGDRPVAGVLERAVAILP